MDRFRIFWEESKCLHSLITLYKDALANNKNILGKSFSKGEKEMVEQKIRDMIVNVRYFEDEMAKMIPREDRIVDIVGSMLSEWKKDDRS